MPRIAPPSLLDILGFSMASAALYGWLWLLPALG
jgi:hypothetical protein